MEKGKRLIRKRVFEIILILFLSGVMIFLYFLGRARNLPQTSFSSQADLELREGIFFSRMEQGKLRLVLKGKDLQYERNLNSAWLKEPEIEILDEQETIRVFGNRARYLAEEGTIQLQEGVKIDYQDYRAETNSLNYSLKTGVAESEDEIEIKGKGVWLKGKGYRFDSKQGEIEIFTGVKGRFQKQKG